jgi:hypothetical protein
VLAGVVALAVVLIAAGALALALTRSARHDTVRNAGDSKAAAARAAAAGRLAANVASAATWVVGQVSPTVEVSCDPAMCQALAQRGFPVQRLDELGQMRANPFASTIVVATPALRRQFGAGLNADWAPEVLAGFGGGSERVTVRVMAKRGAHAYTSALRADRRQRGAVGAFLIASSQVVTTPAAKSALAAGDVDARLLLAISALASQHPIDILAFGQTWPGASADIPLRTAELAANDPAAYLPELVYLQAVTGLLRLQPAAYRPAHISTVRFAGRTALRIEFPAPSPLGLLSAYQ